MQRFERKWFASGSNLVNDSGAVALQPMRETKFNALPTALRDQYEKAKQAFDRDNLDYAITLLENVLKKVPSCYDARQVLRATQIKRHDGKTGFFKKMLGTASSSSAIAKAQIAIHTNPEGALQQIEPILANDPNSALAHRTLAQAAMLCEFPKTAVLSLEIAYRNTPNDKETAMKLADALIAAGNPRRAEDILHELTKEIPNDPDLIQALKNATAKRTLGEGGYEKIAEGGGSYRDILRDEEEAVRLEDENRSTKGDASIERLAAEYEARRKENPEDLDLLRKLADLYRNADQIERALPLFEELVASPRGSNMDVHQILAELKLTQFDRQAEQLDPANDTYEAEYQEIQARKVSFEFENASELAERFPTDLKLRLDLGRLYFDQGEITKAIKELQRAQANPHLKPKAQHLLAKCFTQRGMLDLAERTLQAALKEKVELDKEKKELLYDLGVIQESAGKAPEAIEQFKLIYEIDIDYRDVSQRVDDYYANL